MAYAPAPNLISDHGLSVPIKAPKKTPAKKPPVVKTKVPKAPAAAPKSLAQQQIDEAAALATAQTAPQKADINQQIKDAQTQKANAAQTTLKLQEAMQALNAGDPAAAKAAFQDAADSIAGYAKGLTGNLGSLEQAQAAQQSAQVGAIGAPGGPVVDHGADNANIDNLVGGVIPATTLATGGAAEFANAQTQNRASGTRILDQGSANDFQSQKTIDDFRQKILDLDAQYPGLVTTALQGIKQQANAERATNTQIGYLQLQQAKTLDQQALAWTNITGTLHVIRGTGKSAHIVDTGVPAGGSAAAVAQAKNTTAQNAIDAANARAAAANAAKIAAAKITKAGKIAAAQIAKQKAQGKPPTVQQKAAVIKAANASGNAIVTSRVAQIWQNNVPPQQKGEDSKTYQAHHKTDVANARRIATWNWYKIYAVVFAAMNPYLTSLGWTPEQKRLATRTALASQITPPKGQ